MRKLFAVPAAPLSPVSGKSEAAKILAVGQEASALYTRGLVLERTGASVRCAHFELAIALLRVAAFDVVVLCHTLSAWEVKRLCSEARLAKTSTRLLLLVSPTSAAIASFEVDMLVQLEDGPRALQEGAERLLVSQALPRMRTPNVPNITRPKPAFGAVPQALHP